MSVHAAYMHLALIEAQKAKVLGEVPVGAVIVYGDKVIASAHNLREQTNDPTAHAEVLAMREAAQVLNSRRLLDCTMYVTLEPCPMCAGAMVMACLGACYYAANDAKQGCCGSVYDIPEDPAFSHRTKIIGGILEEEAKALLVDFFSGKRS